MSEQQSPGKHAAHDDDETRAGDSGDTGDVGSAGESAEGARQPGADPEDAEEIEQERQERLDPGNRPDNVEVDNTDRDFDPEKGMFTDSEGYDQADPEFPAAGEQGA
jgi:hypothetical protein